MMVTLRAALAVLLLGALAACGGKSVWAPDEEIVARRVVTGEPPYLMLKTMIHNRTGRGGHSALLINGSELVMYDPAGRWRHSTAPERNDVVYGLTPPLLAQYDSFHARNTHHVVSQKIYVTPEVAAQAAALAKAKGPSLDAQCSINTSSMLQQLPGFGGIDRTWFPHRLMDQFAKLPGVETTKHFEDDIGKN